MKTSLLCVHRNYKYWSSVENQLARLWSIIHHITRWLTLLQLCLLCSHFTTLPHPPDSGSGLSSSIGSGPGCQAAGPPSALGQQSQSQSQATKLNWELGNYGNPLVTPYFNCNLHVLYDAWVCVSQYLARSDSGVQVGCCDSGSGAGQTETGARDSGHETRGYIPVTFTYNLCS